MKPQSRERLAAFNNAAKAVIYEPARMEQFMSMLDSPEGALQAVQTVIGAIEQRKPVPPDMAPLLGINIYVLLVDMAHEITGEDPDPEIVERVIGMVFQELRKSHGAAQPPSDMQPGRQMPAQPAAQPAAPSGLIAQSMGA